MIASHWFQAIRRVPNVRWMTIDGYSSHHGVEVDDLRRSVTQSDHVIECVGASNKIVDVPLFSVSEAAGK